jgi:hypothetical protein
MEEQNKNSESGPSVQTTNSSRMGWRTSLTITSTTLTSAAPALMIVKCQRIRDAMA